jgi:hypothetical protein
MITHASHDGFCIHAWLYHTVPLTNTGAICAMALGVELQGTADCFGGLHECTELTRRQQQQMEARTGRPGGQGPELALSSTSRQSVHLMVSGLKGVQEYLLRVLGPQEGQRMLAALSPAAVMTLVVENFVAITRKHNPNPSALQQALLVPVAVREQHKRSATSLLILHRQQTAQ